MAVAAMFDLKGVTGRARAWVRLSLEKKTLSAHLTALIAYVALKILSDQLIVLLFTRSRKQPDWAGMYRPHAFLFNEDHRDQLLSHFLALTTVDVNVFTPHFPTAEVPYRVAITTAKCVLFVCLCFSIA
jgi:hypothetical protein